MTGRIRSILARLKGRPKTLRELGRETLPSPKKRTWFDRIGVSALLAGIAMLILKLLRVQTDDHQAREHTDNFTSDESLTGDEFNPQTTPPPEDRSGAGSR